MTKKEFAAGLGILCANFGKVYDKQTLDIFYSLLKDIDPENFLKAILAICRGQKELYPGTNVTALIRHKAVELTLSLPSPEEAWEMIVTGFDCRAVNLKDQPLVRRAAEAIGGLDSIRFRYRVDLDSDPGIVRAQFIKQYSSLAYREHAEHVAPISIEEGDGILQIENTENG